MNKILIVSLLFAFAFCITVHQEGYASKAKERTWDTISVDALVNNQWKLYNDNGFVGNFGFREDGTISIHDNNNERTWILDNSNFLNIRRGDGTPSCIFTHAFRDYFGKWHLEGRFRFIDGGWRHFLVQQ